MKLNRPLLETVLVFVRDSDDRYLFMARGKKPGDVHAGKYNCPGGKVEQGESPVDTMKREVLEETGLTVTNYRRLGFLAFPGFHTGDGGEPIDESTHVFLVTGWTGELIADSPEGDLEWVERKRVLQLPLWEGDRRFIPFVLAGRRFEGKLTYRHGELAEWWVEEG